MAKKKSHDSELAELTELIRDLLIVELRKAGASKEAIRSIVRCESKRVLSVIKHLRPGKTTVDN